MIQSRFYNGKIGDAGFLKKWKKYDKLNSYTADLKYIERKNKKLEKEIRKENVRECFEELSNILEFWYSFQFLIFLSMKS